MNYTKITTDVISEIREKLFELQTKERRTEFLKYVFRGFFDNGKDCCFYQVNELEYKFENLSKEEKKFSDDEFSFIYNCLLCLREIVIVVSDDALNYDIDFESIMLWRRNTSG